MPCSDAVKRFSTLSFGGFNLYGSFLHMTNKQMTYAFIGAFSLLLFIFCSIINKDATGFASTVLFWVKFVPVATAGLSVWYYINAGHDNTTNTITLTGGYVFSKSIYYITVGVSSVLTFLVCWIANNHAEGAMSMFSDFLSVLAVAAAVLAYLNYKAITAPVPTTTL